jgi:hypothetical protein
MVVAERQISVLVKFFGPSLETIDVLHKAIRADFVSVVEDHMDNNTEEFHIQILTDFKCANCGEPAPSCKCGKPAIRPAV